MIQGGSTANNNGQKLENKVEQYYNEQGYISMTYKEYEKLTKEVTSKTKLLVKNYPYDSIYGHRGKTEFMAIDNNIKTRIECKAQFSAGSVDEKLPYLFLNAIHAFPEDNIIIIHEGNGFKKGALDWLHKSANDFNKLNSTNKNIKVTTYDNFIK